MTSDRANGPHTPPASGQDASSPQSQDQLVIIREEVGGAARETASEPGSKITVEKVETEPSPEQPRGKLVLFPRNFSLHALEDGATTPEPHRTEHEDLTPPPEREDDGSSTLKRRGTLKRLLNRRARKKELESFLRTRFKQMVLTEFMGKKPVSNVSTPDPAAEIPLPDPLELAARARQPSARKLTRPQSAFKNSKGMKFRSAIQKAALEKTSKPSTRSQTAAKTKKPKRVTKKKTAKPN